MIQGVLKKYINAKTSKETLYSFGLKAVQVILGPITGILLAQYLGASGYGQYTFALSILYMVTIPATFGLQQVVIRFASQYLNSNSIGKLRGLFFFSNAVVFCLSILILVAFSVLFLFKNDLWLQYRRLIYVALIALPFLSSAKIKNASLKGIDKVIYGQIPELVVQPLVLVVLILILYAVNYLTVLTATLSFLASVIISLLMGISFLKKTFYDLQNVLPAKSYNYKKWLSTAYPLMILGSIQLFNRQIDSIFLGTYISGSDVGIYKAALQISSLQIIGIGVINTVIAPKISRLYSQKKVVKLRNIIFKGNILNFIISLAVGIVILFWGKTILGFIFGKEFIRGFIPLIILSFANVIDGITGTYTITLKMIGQEKLAAVFTFISAVIGITLNYLLIPSYGMIGAAIATSTSLIIWKISLFIIAKLSLSDYSKIANE